MSTIVKPYTFSAGTKIVAAEHNSNFDTIYADYNGGITNANISGSAAIADTKLAQIATASKVSGAALTILSSIPSAAGVIPSYNLGTGTTAGLVFLKGDGTWTAIDTGVGIATDNLTGLSPLVISGGSGATFTAVTASVNTGTLSVIAPIAVSGGTQSLLYNTTVSVSTANLTAISPVVITGGTSSLLYGAVASVNTADLTVKSPLAVTGGTGSILYATSLSVTTANMVGTAPIVVTGGSGSIMASTTLSITTATGSLTGALDSTDWNTFNGKWATQTTGDISATDPISVTAGRQALSGALAISISTTIPVAAVEFVMDGGGSVITDGTKGYLEVPFACMITSFTALGDTTGTINIDIKKCTYATFPTTASIISGGATISAGVSTQNTVLTNWALVTSAGSILEFYASGCTNFTRVTTALKVVKL